MKPVVFSPEAMEDYHYWKSANPAFITKIKQLLSDMSEHPFTGIGKPEPLKHELSGKWSRRINSKHRVIYVVRIDDIYILSLRFHYSKK